MSHVRRTKPYLATDVQTFVDRARGATSLRALHTEIDDFSRSLGFEHFALIQHGPIGPVRPIQLSNYPASWIEAMLERRLLAEDPVLVLAQRTAAPFEWIEIDKRLQLTDRQRLTLAASAAHGIGPGFTIPLHVPGEPMGLFSFALPKGQSFDGDQKPIAQYAACFAFEASRRLARAPAAENGLPRLTQRQLDCLVLLAKGKSESVTGQLLGLSPRTVHKYMEHAKSRYDVASKSQLIVRALFEGEITYADIL
jgi:LuxR family transcriptional regulator, quorum-sensing system regulator CciR